MVMAISGKRISAANGNIRPESLTIGQKLTIPQEGTPSVPSGGGMTQEILNAHNSYRSQVGVPFLTWSDTLANEAQQWANYLAANGLFQHSGAKGEGENIWMGTSGAYSFTQMIQSFGSEKSAFCQWNVPKC